MSAPGDPPDAAPTEDEELLRVLGRTDLPPAFERWRLTLAAGAERPTHAGEWAGAIVLVERGRVAVQCDAGGWRTFEAGDLLALGWLPLRRLRNPGRGAARLVAVRRRGRSPREAALRVIRAATRRGTGEPGRR